MASAAAAASGAQLSARLAGRQAASACQPVRLLSSSRSLLLNPVNVSPRHIVNLPSRVPRNSLTHQQQHRMATPVAALLNAHFVHQIAPVSTSSLISTSPGSSLHHHLVLTSLPPPSHGKRRFLASRASGDSTATGESTSESKSESSTESGPQAASSPSEASTTNGAATAGKPEPSAGVVGDVWAVKPGGELPLGGPTGFLGHLGLKLRLLFEPPWKRVKKGSVLSLRLSGQVRRRCYKGSHKLTLYVNAK